MSYGVETKKSETIKNSLFLKIIYFTIKFMCLLVFLSINNFISYTFSP